MTLKARKTKEIPPDAIRFTQTKLDHRCRLTIPALMRRSPVDWKPGDVIEIELITPFTIKLTNRTLIYRQQERE